MANLTPSQTEALNMFREVTAGAREEEAAVQILTSCGWSVEQALQLHWAAGDDHSVPAAAAASSSGALGAPLLRGGGSSDEARGSAGSGSSSSPPRAAAAAAAGSSSGLVSSLVAWITGGLRRIGATFFSFICTFIFGPGGPRIGGGPTSGAAFSGALAASYGANLQLPRFFEGSFTQALQTAQRELKLLVVFLHSEHARDAQSFCTNVLGNDIVKTMLDEGFVLWGGDIARMEAHHVSQMIHARQYPCFCVLLPASVDEIRVIGAVQGEVQVDSTIALLVGCSEEMDSHRSEIVARSAQHVEDRYLREEQDREYQQALEMDKKRQEERAAQERVERESQREAEELRKKEEEEFARFEADRISLDTELKRQAAALGVPGADATVCIALRLPAGQRVQRKFRPTAPLSEVYVWASCVGYLSEHEGRGLEIPKRFMLKTSFPCRDLTEMESTIDDLKLAGSQLVLAEIEDES